jgi:hypothetical protein
MIERLNNNEGVKRSQTTAGQRELLREMREKLNELIESVNDHEDMIYGCGCDIDDDDGDEVETIFDDVCPDCGEVLREVDTTDGLFSDFTAYVAAHPGLRLWQALRNWTGYSKIYGEAEDGELEDTFYLKSKGPSA